MVSANSLGNMATRSYFHGMKEFIRHRALYKIVIDIVESMTFVT